MFNHFIADSDDAREAMIADEFPRIFVPEDAAPSLRLPAGWIFYSAGHERDGRLWTMYGPRHEIVDVPGGLALVRM